MKKKNLKNKNVHQNKQLMGNKFVAQTVDLNQLSGTEYCDFP